MICFCFVPTCRFLLQFVAGSGLDQGVATLHVVETNPFKHLTHLSLKFLPGSDAEVKKYLANCLKNLQVKLAMIFVITGSSIKLKMFVLNTVNYQAIFHKIVTMSW